MDEKHQIDAEVAIEFMRIRIEGCRKGGMKSGFARRAKSVKRKHAEIVINNFQRRGYDRDSAVKIAKHVGCSVRYIRKLVKEKQNKTE